MNITDLQIGLLVGFISGFPAGTAAACFIAIIGHNVEQRRLKRRAEADRLMQRQGRQGLGADRRVTGFHPALGAGYGDAS